MAVSQERISPGRVLLSAAFWTYLATSSAFWWVGAVAVRVATSADQRRERLHAYTSLWAYHYVLVSPFWHVTFEGRKRIPPGPCVFVANHQSLGDILVLFGLRTHFKWVSKASVFLVPFIGWNMAMNDYVKLERGDKASIAKMMEACRRHLEAGSPVFLFPEGTRSPDGELHAFKHGAFSLACELGVPIVPIVVEGTKDALPKHGFVFRNGRRLDVLVRVLDPVDPVLFGGDRTRLSDHVHDTIARTLAEIRAERALQPPAERAS